MTKPATQISAGLGAASRPIEVRRAARVGAWSGHTSGLSSERCVACIAFERRLGVFICHLAGHLGLRLKALQRQCFFPLALHNDAGQATDPRRIHPQIGLVDVQPDGTRLVIAHRRDPELLPCAADIARC